MNAHHEQHHEQHTTNSKVGFGTNHEQHVARRPRTALHTAARPADMPKGIQWTQIDEAAMRRVYKLVVGCELARHGLGFWHAIAFHLQTQPSVSRVFSAEAVRKRVAKWEARERLDEQRLHEQHHEVPDAQVPCAATCAEVLTRANYPRGRKPRTGQRRVRAVTRVQYGRWLVGDAVRTRSAVVISRAWHAGPWSGTRGRLAARQHGVRLVVEQGSRVGKVVTAIRSGPGPGRHVLRRGQSGCGNPLCRCDVDDDGFEISPLSMLTRQIFVTAARLEWKQFEWRLLGQHWISRIFHRNRTGGGYDLSRPRRFRSLQLFARCTHIANAPPDSHFRVGVGEIVIVPSVQETFPAAAAAGVSCEPYRSNAAHIRVAYDRDNSK